MTKEEFFCVCENCSSTEWIENLKGEREKINSLTKEGLMRYPWKIDAYVYNAFSDMKISEKNFYEKKNWFSADEKEDLICFECEKKLRPITFSEVNKNMRKKIWAMKYYDRIRFAQSYRMVKIIEKNK